MKTVIEMAREVYGEHTFWTGPQLERLEQFAELVRKDYSFTHAQMWLKRFDDAILTERKAMMQLFTDPENQPTQYGTVTVQYMLREIAAERETCAGECDEWIKNGSELAEDIAAAIRARGKV